MASITISDLPAGAINTSDINARFDSVETGVNNIDSTNLATSPAFPNAALANPKAYFSKTFFVDLPAANAGFIRFQLPNDGINYVVKHFKVSCRSLGAGTGPTFDLNVASVSILTGALAVTAANTVTAGSLAAGALAVSPASDITIDCDSLGGGVPVDVTIDIVFKINHVA